MLLDEEEVPYVVGDCFVRLAKEEAEERLGEGAWAGRAARGAVRGGAPSPGWRPLHSRPASHVRQPPPPPPPPPPPG